MKYNRREFVKQLGMLSGSILLFPRCSTSSWEQKYRVFTNTETACLIALCEQIIPADEDPGATDAEVICFIDKQTALRFPEEKQILKDGVSSLQKYCRSIYDQLFEELNPTTQIHIMEQMEKRELPVSFWPEVDQADFFNLLISRTMQGFYGSPRHGGNKDYISYRMLKLDYPLLVGQNRYRS